MPRRSTSLRVKVSSCVKSERTIGLRGSGSGVRVRGSGVGCGAFVGLSLRKGPVFVYMIFRWEICQLRGSFIFAHTPRTQIESKKTRNLRKARESSIIHGNSPESLKTNPVNPSFRFSYFCDVKYSLKWPFESMGPQISLTLVCRESVGTTQSSLPSVPKLQRENCKSLMGCQFWGY